MVFRVCKAETCARRMGDSAKINVSNKQKRSVVNLKFLPQILFATISRISLVSIDIDREGNLKLFANVKKRQKQKMRFKNE